MIKPPRRRWLRFRLRTLLIAIAVIAVPLGWIAKEQRQSRYESQIATELTNNGAEVVFASRFDYEENYFDHDPQNPVPIWWRKALSDIYGPRIWSVEVLNGEEGFDFVTPMSGLTSIRDLDLDGITATDLSPLAQVVSLNSLYLFSAPVQDLTPLRGLKNLRYLILQSTDISDILPLSELKQLETISIKNTKIRDLQPVATLKHLLIIDIDKTQVSDLKPLAGLRDLVEVSLNHTSVSDLSPLAGHDALRDVVMYDTPVRDLTPLIGLKSLERVSVDNANLDARQIEEFRRAMPNCQVRVEDIVSSRK